MLKQSMVAVLAAAGLVFGSVHASAADRMPTGKWVVEFADRDCLMSRQFGTQEKPLTLAFRKMPMDGGATLLLVYPGKNKKHRSGKARLQFVPGEPPVEVGFAVVGLLKEDIQRLTINLPEEQILALLRAGRVSVSVPHELDAAFHLSQLPDVFKLGNECAIGLGEAWGFTRQEQALVKTPPKGSLGASVSSSDYPQDALNNLESGQTRARLSIGTDGRVSNCAVVRTSGNDSIDEATCGVAKRAWFKPARDAQGNRVRGLVVYTITWLAM